MPVGVAFPGLALSSASPSQAAAWAHSSFSPTFRPLTVTDVEFASEALAELLAAAMSWAGS